MTALSITAANVVAGSNAKKIQGIAGETITAGQAVYRDATTKKFLKSDADSATAAAHNVDGVALNGASLNQPLAVQIEGDIDLGATLTVGEVYVLDTGAGGIAPVGDLDAAEYVAVIGVANSVSNLKMNITNSGVAVPTPPPPP